MTFIPDGLWDRPVRVSVNVNGSKPKFGKWRFRAILWVNGYPFDGIEWETEAEAERDAERLRSALEAAKLA